MSGETGELGTDLAFDSLSGLARLLRAGEVTSVEIVELALDRVASLDSSGPSLHSVLAVDPDALGHAAALDAERRGGHVRGPLHGVPVLVKDNIETAGVLGATAGSLALLGVAVEHDAPAVALLRAGGAVVLGKTNLSEWANFRSSHSVSGWSAVGGQTRNPHVLDRSPGGSSAGSGAAVAAGLAPLALGTETDGSIVCPAAFNGVVGLKATHGLVSADGVVPLAPSQDCVGPMGRHVADVAAALDVLVAGGPLGGRMPSGGYRSQAVEDGLAGARIGVARLHFTGASPVADRLFGDALAAMRDGGARLVDPADVPTAVELAGYADELLVMSYEIHDSLDRYLRARDGGRGACPGSLAELVEYNDAHSEDELALFGQDLLVGALATDGLASPVYRAAFARNRERARERGIDAALAGSGADVLVTLTSGPAGCIDQVNGDPSFVVSSSAAAVAGYPTLSMPIGTASGLPVGVSLIGRPFAEATLLRIGAGLEHVLGLEIRPGFLPSVPLA
ncbi:MAG: amidase family protein [Acidimicrobiales bacterium]